MAVVQTMAVVQGLSADVPVPASLTAVPPAPLAPAQRIAPSGIDDVRIVGSNLVLAERVMHFSQIAKFSAEYKAAEYRNERSDILWWSGLIALGLALAEIKDTSVAQALVMVAVGAVALAAYYAGQWLSPPAELVTPERWTLVVETKDEKSLPLFTTEDGDFAERVSRRLDALLCAAEEPPHIVIDPRAKAIRSAQPVDSAPAGRTGG